MAIEYLGRAGLPDLAYHAVADGGKGLPALMFLGGFRSDMEGTKALYLEQQCRARGQAYVRFDYSGHGRSGGRFDEGTIGMWRDDALAVLDALTAGPVILAGSSMGGWIALLLGMARPERVAGIVGIAAAPDFTRWIDGALDGAQRRQMAAQGYIDQPSAYSEEPYRITRRLIEEGEQHCLLDKKTSFSMSIRLIQGMRDDDVPWQTAHRIKNAVQGAVEVFLVETGDHRLSTPDNLALIDSQVRALSGL